MKTKETSTVKKVDPNYHKIECTFFLIFLRMIDALQTELWSHPDLSRSICWAHVFLWKEWWVKEMFCAVWLRDEFTKKCKFCYLHKVVIWSLLTGLIYKIRKKLDLYNNLSQKRCFIHQHAEWLEVYSKCWNSKLLTVMLQFSTRGTYPANLCTEFSWWQVIIHSSKNGNSNDEVTQDWSQIIKDIYWN